MPAFRRFAPFAIIIGLGACGTRPQPPVPQIPERGAPAPPPSVSAADFVAANGSIDLFVIRSSELALQRSPSPRVRDFATQMIAGHKGTSAQLSLAGRRLNLLPSAAMLPAEQAMLDALATTGSFDAEYVRDQRLVHQQAIALDSTYGERGASPTLRSVAKAGLSIEQRHFRLLAYL